jgi:hypothetical protein
MVMDVSKYEDADERMAANDLDELLGEDLLGDSSHGGARSKRRREQQGLLEKATAWAILKARWVVREVPLAIQIWSVMAAGATVSLAITYQPHRFHVWMSQIGTLQRILQTNALVRKTVNTIDTLMHSGLIFYLLLPFTVSFAMALLPIRTAWSVLTSPEALRIIIAISAMPSIGLYMTWLTTNNGAWIPKHVRQPISVLCTAIACANLVGMVVVSVGLKLWYPLLLQWLLGDLDLVAAAVIVLAASVAGTIYAIMYLESGLHGEPHKMKGSKARDMHVSAVGVAHIAVLAATMTLRVMNRRAFARARTLVSAGF